MNGTGPSILHLNQRLNVISISFVINFACARIFSSIQELKVRNGKRRIGPGS